MPSKSKVYFFFDHIKFSFQNRSGLKRFIEEIFKKEKKHLSSLNYIFCSDKRLLEINKEFLNHDFFTDIITFDLSEDENIYAEVYISVDRVKENSRVLKTSFTSELHRVLFHGALHLCGYKDKTKAEKKKMRDKEEYYLNHYFI